MRSVLLRSALIAGAGLLALAPLSSGADAASSVLVNVTGSAPAAVSGPATVTFSYSVTVPSAVTAATFTTHQDPRLPALPSGVKLDGLAVRAAQVGAVDLSVNAGALRAGVHVLTVQASVPGGDAASTSSLLTFAYTAAGGLQSRSSAPVVVAINEPDLAVALTPGVGQAPGVIGRIGTGRIAAVAVDVSNVGAGDPSADLLLTFPAGLELAAPGVTRAGSGTAVACGGVAGRADQVSCALGAVLGAPGGSPGADTLSLIIAVTTTAHPPVDTIAALGIAVQPAGATAGVDANPANNSTQLGFTFTGAARLAYAIHSAAATLRVGAVDTVTVTVRNDSANPTTRTLGFVVLDKKRLRILAFSRTALPSGQSNATLLAQELSPGFAGLAPGASFVGAGLTTAAAGPATGDGLVWDVGPLASGQTASAKLTVRASALGGTKLSFVAVSDVADPACPQLGCVATTAAVRVVPASAPAVLNTPAASAAATPSVTPSTPAPTTVTVAAPAQHPVAAAPALASTGAATFDGTGVGFGLVIFGIALLTALGRPRNLAAADRYGSRHAA